MSGLVTTEPPTDSDQDGMSDAWELIQGLNPQNGNDHATIMPSGYTAIEVYINDLASQVGEDLIFIDEFE